MGIIKQGSLTVVGTGISVSGQMTLLTESVLKNADIVLAVVTDSALSNLKSINPNTVDMRDYYQEGISRLITYRKMAQRQIDETIAGKRVVAAFYGHPGVFVNPSHDAISELKKMGYRAEMLPGISAEDCLIADLGLDPCARGCQSYEATQFLFRQYTLYPYMLQIIWQISVIASFAYKDQSNKFKGMTVLQDVLLKDYPSSHEVIIYEAATIPIVPPRIEKIPLSKLADVTINGISTLVVPALGLPDYDLDTMAKFGLTEESFLEQLES